MGAALIRPSLDLTPSVVLLMVAVVGTTITPYMQFYLQSAVAEKGIGEEELRLEQADAVGGAIWTNVIAVFIVVATATTIFAGGGSIETAEDAARALGPVAGELSTALRLKPRHTIHDLLTADTEEDDVAGRLEDYLERHESGIRVLAAPDDPEQADAIEAFHVATVIEAARSKFDYVIIDTPTALSEGVLVALEQADQIFCLATLDLPSVRNLGVMLNTLKKLKVPVERVTLLLNKVEPDVGIDVARVEQYFPQGFSMVIPYGREVNRSLNMGQPVLAYANRSEVSRTLLSGIAGLLPGATGNDETGPEAPPPKRRRSWRQRKSA